jgi:hypothetical protein
VKTVKFEQFESNNFRVVHADGAFGGPTPSGLLYAVFFSQTPPIPKEVAYEVKDDGNLGDEISSGRSSSSAIQRRIEVGVLMDLNTAKAFYQWLGQQIEQLEKTVLSAQSEGKK